MANNYTAEDIDCARAEAYQQGRQDGLQHSADIRERQAAKDARFDKLHAQARRDRMAAAALQGLLAACEDVSVQQTATDAVAYADALLAVLNEGDK